MTMTIHSRMLAGLALTVATLVTVSSDALARSGGMGGMGGMRSFSAVRTSPVVISKVRTTSVSAVRKQTVSAVSQAKLKNFQAGDKLKNKQVVDKLKNKQDEDKLKRNAKLSPHATPCISPLATAAAAPCPGGGGGGGGGTGT